MTVQEAQAKAAALEANVNRWLSQALHLRQHGRAASKASRRDMAEELEALAFAYTAYIEHIKNQVKEAIGE